MFGAGNEMDAFIVAFRMPNLVRDLFGEGSMSAAFVPTFTRVLTVEGRNAAWRLGNNVLNALLVVTGSLVAIGLVLAQPIVAAYAADFAAVPGKLELTVRLTRVMLPFLVAVAIAAALMGMLNSLHHYFVPALAPAVFNLATIAGAFTLVPLMPALGWPPIMAIAIAAMVGGVGQAAVQWPALRREGFRYRAVLDWRDPELRQGAAVDGPGHARHRGDAGQRLHQHAPRHERGHRRGLVADLRVSIDLPADRSVRRLDCDGGSAGGVALRRGRRLRPASATRCRGACP